MGRAFARLYAANTVGGVLGVAVGATVAFEAFGNRGTVTLAAALQVVAALGAVVLALRGSAPAAPPATAPDPTSTRARSGGGGLVWAAALAGAAGVGTQVAWGRRLTPVLGATFLVFASVLAIHLIAIALGSALLGPRRARRPRLALGLLAITASIATAGTAFALGPVVEAVQRRWEGAYGDPLAMLGLRAAAAAVLVLPGVLFGAALLPWLVRAATVAERHPARVTGRIVAANTVGGAAGGLLVALWGIPAVGTMGSLWACAGALLLAGACGLSGAWRGACALTGVLVALLPFVAPWNDTAGTTAVGALYAPSTYRPGDTLTRLARDGRTASVLVRDREGVLEYWVEGSLESSTVPTDRLHLGLLGHLPMVLFAARSERAPHVALVGLGGGLTAQAVASHAPRRLDVYELEPLVAEAAETFRIAGGGLPAGATLHIADGRRGILDEAEPLDVISSDPVHPSVAGSAYLYSVEWWRAAVERLSPEGLLVQWLPLYQLHGDEIRLTLRTFVASVPYPYVFLAGSDALLVASRTPLRLSARRLERVLDSDAGRALDALGLGTPGRLLGLLALDPDGCRAVAGSGELNTDDRLLLELRSGWREGNDPGAAYALLRRRRADPRTLLDGPADAAFDAELLQADELEAALAAWVRWNPWEALRRFRAIAEREPGNELAAGLRDQAEHETARAYFTTDRPEEAAEVARALAARVGVAPTLRLDAAEILVRTGAVEEGRRIAAPYAAAHGWPRARRLAAGLVD